jgi:methyl-accepting chemotaxis protein
MHQRRRNLIINKRFQLKFCVFVCFWMLVLKYFGAFLPATILVFVGALLTALIISHRIAGPVYRIETALERWKNGNVESNLHLRTGDEFQKLADAYNAAAHEYVSLRNQMRNTSKFLHTLADDLEPKHRAQIQEMIGELECRIEKKT